jgi:hypothetical protein
MGRGYKKHFVNLHKDDPDTVMSPFNISLTLLISPVDRAYEVLDDLLLTVSLSNRRKV